MKDMVQFVTVTTEPAKDSPDVMKAYGEAHGLDSANWMFLTAPRGTSEDMTHKLANTYDQRFDPLTDGQQMQMHGVVTHVIDINGRFAAKFHGMRFKPVNLILYINGLINDPHHDDEKPAPVWRDWLEGPF